MRVISRCNVAVVGGAGFLGSHLVNHLIEDRDCSVLVVDNLCAGRREFVHSKARLVHHDITQSETFLHALFARHHISFVFNYAAWPYVPDSFGRPLHVFATNATGAMHVINAAHGAGVKGILQVSSAELYGDSGLKDALGNDPPARINEHFPVMPHSTYGAAKAAADYYCQASWKERGAPVIALRQFNCIGERETHPYVLPEIISQLDRQVVDTGGPASWGMLRWKPAAPDKSGTVSLGNNSARDFLYAGDAVRAAAELLERGRFGEVYNLGSESSIKVYDLAQLAGACVGFEKVTVTQDPARVRPWEIWHLQSDNTKINGVISHRQGVSLEAAVRRAVQDYYSQGRRWCWE